MRSVCHTWREVIPSTQEPLLVLSLKQPSMQSEVLFMEIARSSQVRNVAFKVKFPLSRPPSGASCWGSALGLLAMRWNHGNQDDIFVYCAHCAEKKQLLNLPPESTPKGIFLEPLTPQRFLLMSMAEVGEDVLRVDRDDYPWDLNGASQWLATAGFGDIPLRSVALLAGVFRAAASRDSIIIIDESGRCLDSPDELIELQTPPIYLSDGSLTSVWDTNGQHLFICQGQLYYTEIFDMPDADDGVGVRLFLITRSSEGDYAILPVSSIGQYSVYVGVNQSFVLPSHDTLIGRRSNTLYIEDFNSNLRHRRVFAINFESLHIAIIPYPDDLTVDIEECLPAVWVGMPEPKDIVNHCRANESWRFWD